MSNDEKKEQDNGDVTMPIAVFLDYHSQVGTLVTEMALSLRSAQYENVKLTKRIEELQGIVERMKLERLK